MSNTQSQQLMVEWHSINWRKLERSVYKLQKRIYQASARGDVKAYRRLQKTLMKSWSARALAVRRVTQDNQGKKTAGVDGVKSLTPKQRLEPEWEARFEPNSYGFRPGRSCHDAVEAIFSAIRLKPKYVLDADIAKCFDRINQEALLRKLNTFPTIRRQVRAWLKAGVMDNKQLFPTSEGTPQGGVISPLLANIALHGMEERIKQYAETLPGKSGIGKRDNRRSLSLIRYADDFVILHENLTVVQRCKEIISEWLKGMGLELKPSKTRLTHTFNKYEQEKPGFDFLGFTIQQFPQGKYHSKQGFKTIITPSKQKQKVHYDRIASVIETQKAVLQAALISHLNPIIRGWANYYATVVSKVAYSDIDDLTYQKLKAWAKRRHPKKNGEWVSKRYWQSIGSENWVFATRKEGLTPLRLLNHADTPIVRHVKVKGESSPYDGNLVYWSTRMGNNPEMPNRISKILKKQKGKCTHCEMFFREDDVLEVDHKIPKSQGGRDSYDNWQLLHRHCHDTKTANDSSIGTKSGCNSAEPKPTRKLERVKDKWVMRYA